MVIKCNLSFVFKALRRGANRSFHVVPYFSIQVNKKLNVMVQSITRVQNVDGAWKTCIRKI